MHKSTNEDAPLLQSLHHVLTFLSKAVNEEAYCNPNIVILALQQYGWRIDLEQQVGVADIWVGLNGLHHYRMLMSCIKY